MKLTQKPLNTKPNKTLKKSNSEAVRTCENKENLVKQKLTHENKKTNSLIESDETIKLDSAETTLDSKSQESVNKSINKLNSLQLGVC